MRRALAWLVGLLLLLVVVAFLVPFIASEAGEVVVLHTTTAEGESTTRLWVVEHDGDQWLRSGGGESGWSHRIAANPQVRIERKGRMLSCLAEDRSCPSAVILSPYCAHRSGRTFVRTALRASRQRRARREPRTRRAPSGPTGTASGTSEGTPRS